MLRNQSLSSGYRGRMRSAGTALVLVLLSGGIGVQGAEPPSAEPAAAIRLNTIGYRPESLKQATIAGHGERFIIRDVRNGSEVLQGQLSPPASAAAPGETLLVADFSALDRDGTYRLELADGETSDEFRVSKDIYNWPYYCAMRGMYLWRCGTQVSTEFAGQHYEHAACHLKDCYLDYVGGPAGEQRDGTGGWHDAGDYNKYTVNSAFALGMMLQAWEHFPEKLAPLNLDIPESGNQIPDFLDEARWELDWLLKMQADDGRVYHKLSTLKFGGFILPEKETERRYFSPWGSAATADFAAIMAQAARVFRTVDDPFASRCLAAAQKSYAFLQAHPADHRPDLSAFSTGPYDTPDTDDRLWAAAELWATTGDPAYLRDFEKRCGEIKSPSGEQVGTVDANWDWDNLRNLGTFTYLLSKRPGRDEALVNRIRQDTLQTADSLVEAARRHPYGRPLDALYYWGCNATVARQAMNLSVAYQLTGDDRYRTTMLAALDHLFGRNPFGRSFVTGLGHQPPMFPHDRRSGGDAIVAPWPGYLVGGAWPTASDWFDDQESYKTNEIAINWNGALIYALAAFVEPQSFEPAIKTAQNKSRVGVATEE